MNRAEANRILDRARAGENVPTWQITEALCATGDLDGMGDSIQVVRPAGTWERKNASQLAPARWTDGLEPVSSRARQNPTEVPA